MKVVVPFVRDGLAPEVRDLAERLNAELVDVTGDDFGYWALTRRLWAAGEGFITMEQDILPTAAQLDDLANCTEGWCTSSYDYAVNTTEGVQVMEAASFGLGCAGFSTALVVQEADLFRVGPLGQPVPWMSIDIRLADGLGDRGHHPHRHTTVRHLRAEAMVGAYPMLDAWRSRS